MNAVPPVSAAAHPRLRAARSSVYLIFAVNGVLLATLLARLPAIRDDLGLSPQQLGITLLAGSVGSLLALPTAGSLVVRLGVRPLVTGAAVLSAAGVATAGFADDRTVLAAGLFAWGLANGAWDVAMNVEAADVERRLGVTIMPRFHGSWSLGTVVGAGIAAAAAFLGIGRDAHLAVMSVLVLLGALVAVRGFMPTEQAPEAARQPGAGRRSLVAAWKEPRTVLIGVTVLGFALAEGIAGDWLAIAVVDSREVENWIGSAMYGVFLAAVMVGRFAGPAMLDRYGRYRPLLASTGLIATGVLLVVLLPGLVGAVLGALLWGVGVSLGFPVGMTAAADDPVRAATRVSVVASVAYTAFLAGPPLVGLLGERFGVDLALLTAVAAAVLAATTAASLRPVAPATEPEPEAQPVRVGSHQA